ncbi:ATP-dependent DNA helicase [Legionella israelensis]|uniref:DNA 3'-5' helicase n=1 Tax=Legionella israelensis TaxID=454 RepID=A0AAX1EF64_9GAMM|nr:UvrD-helicase domain-containing protein [Legionella israelensis]QBR83729.1 ATP-dependent DNA helicase [Legionella israelensis]
MLSDSEQRHQATDPHQSFIVQAPAGSGKTEILSQRFLRLLANVTSPEQIIALTFTRKAANEMRERIILSLKQASEGRKAITPHQEKTLSLAGKALEQSKKHRWQLLDQPSRLKIMTIDALCQSIAHAMPLQDRQLAFASISDKANKHYITAAQNCIQFAIDHQEYQQDLKNLLLHLDNRQDKLIELFSRLLNARDQWLTLLYEGQEQNKALYEQAIAFIEQHELNRFKQSLPRELAEELVYQSRQIATIENDPESVRYPLRDWNDFTESTAETAKALSALLLTSDNKFRKSFDHHVGLRKNSCPKDYPQIKAASKILLQRLSECPEFLDALLKVKDLPPPHYDENQWEILNALFKLLPLLVGHLHLVFTEHNEVDFTQISQQALSALGTEEQPTDLALYLDHAIHHLLIDEFQDTSILQFQLLSQLVQGWQVEEGKTLFVVGDPMQSIYRFRQAEVGLFLKAQLYGIGPVRLTPIQLQCNFRSTENIVHWVNQQFPAIFPSAFDVESGAVSFHHSIPVLEEREDSKIEAWQFADKIQETQTLVHLIQTQLQQHPQEDIAILVRSRSQLRDLIALLRAEKIPYQGVEIDLLSQLPHIQDLWSLTKALLMPANRLAWLAVLRSPYGGLSLSDLHLLATIEPRESLYLTLSKPEKLNLLSEEGRIRARFIYHILHQALCTRHQLLLSDWIYQTHQQLHGERILTRSEQNDLEQFCLLLDRLEQDGQLSDFHFFETELANLYSKQVRPAKLQVMTIHKAKGLEFDTVILPSLSSSPKASEKPLLRWLKLPRENEANLLLLSPIKAMHEDKCELYDYLGKLEAEKNHYELQRLLYVAVTRAKKALFLFDHKNKAPKDSFRYLLKKVTFKEFENDKEYSVPASSLPLIYQLPLDFYQFPLVRKKINHSHHSSVFVRNDAHLVGVVAHQLLQWICDNHPSSCADIPWNYARHELRQLGFHEDHQSILLKRLEQWLQKLFLCPTGQWIIKPHQDEHNEYALLIQKEGQIHTRIIDRLFIDKNCLWIIDFKTGADNEMSQAAHRQQINEYAQIMATRTEQKIRCGLYYLANNHWDSWDYQS